MVECVDGSCKVQYLSREEKRKEYNHVIGNTHETYKGLRNDLIRIGHQYFDHTIDITSIEENLHDAWDELIHASMVIPPDSSNHDRLVSLVLEVREFGAFSRDRKNKVQLEQQAEPVIISPDHGNAIMPNGQRLWSDLPYLSEDFQAFWTNESMGLKPAERAGLATLTAKLCASGVCPGAMAHCALSLFKQASETKRQVTAFSSDGTSGSEHSPVPLTDLLPACLAWLTYGNFKLAKTCVDGYTPVPISADNDDWVVTTPSHVTVDKGVEQEEFSISRWLFWRKRFGQLYLHGGKEVSQSARKCFELMVGTGAAVGLNIPGEKRYLEHLFEALDKELVARGFKDCVGPEDIEIDPAWANEE